MHDDDTDWRDFITDDAYQAHSRWYHRGRVGSGRLDLEDANLRGACVASLRGSRLVRCDLSQSMMPLGGMDDVEWIDCVIRDANLSDISFDRALLTRCDYSRSLMPVTYFRDAKLVRCVFDHAALGRSRFERARVTHCSFRNAQLENATMLASRFEDCDFRDTALWRDDDIIGWWKGTTFVRCDFRGADLQGRPFAEATFENCAFYGAAGLPLLDATTMLLDSDMSPEYDGTAIVPGPVRDWASLQRP